jgi:phosphoglycolate phosphatase-like HAD superfamily hydrolase
LLIADSVRDEQAAKIVGVPIVAVATGTATAAELRTAGADVVLSALDDTAVVVRAVDDLTRDSV